MKTNARPRIGAFPWRATSLPMVLALLAAPLAAAPAAPPEMLEAWLPGDVIGYVKLSRVSDRLEAFLRSDLKKDLESMGVTRFLMSQEPWKRFQNGLEEFRASSKKDPLQVFRDLLGREVAIAARGGLSGPEIVLLTRAAGEKELEDGLKSIRQAINNRLGFLPEPERWEHDGRAIESYDQLSYARLGAILAVTNARGALQAVIDLSSGKSKASLAASPLFKKAAVLGAKDALFTALVEPRKIPNFRIPDKLDNAVASLLLGGWMGALGSSDLLAGSLSAGDQGLEIHLASALDAGGLPEKHRSFFPDVISDAMASRLEKRGVLLVGKIHRDLAQWWEQRESLLVPKAAGELIQFSQVMSIVFGGRNFQDEVLPEFGPTITIVSANQKYPDLLQKPRPTIPGFAAVFELKGAKKFGNSMVAAFQTLVGIINADRAQKRKEGGMAMLLKSEKVGHTDLHTVALNLPPEAKPDLPYNFTPSMAVVKNRVVVSSSRELAQVLVEELAREPAEARGAPAPARDAIHLDAQAVTSILGENLDLIVAQTMMEKGKGKAEAEGEMNAILEVLKRIRDLRLETSREKDSIHLKLELRPRSSARPVAEEKPAKTARKKRVSL